MIVFVGCPKGCRYHTASAGYDLVVKCKLQYLIPCPCPWPCQCRCPPLCLLQYQDTETATREGTACNNDKYTDMTTVTFTYSRTLEMTRKNTDKAENIDTETRRWPYICYGQENVFIIENLNEIVPKLRSQ